MPAKQPLGANVEHSNDQFLTWHRMYLWYFERVLQAAAGDPSLRLPFWDYANDPTPPATYRDPTYVNEAGKTVPNPCVSMLASEVSITAQPAWQMGCGRRLEQCRRLVRQGGFASAA
jgi:tyrosinase-like protein